MKRKSGKIIEAHVLHQLPVHANNCDELGMIKTVTYRRGDIRSRLSSQSFGRDSKEQIHLFYEEIPEILDFNSRRHVEGISRLLCGRFAFSKEDADFLSNTVYEKIFATPSKAKKGKASAKKNSKKTKEKSSCKEDAETDVLVEEHDEDQSKVATSVLSGYEVDLISKSVFDAFTECCSDKKVKKEDLLKSTIKKVNIDKKCLNGGIFSSLTGRMFASAPTINVSATVQRAHMFTTHSIDIASNIDSFTAMDELLGGDATGASHMDEKSFSCGCYYKSFAIDVLSLFDEDHLGSIKKYNPEFDEKLFLARAIMAYIKALPNGKSNSFFSKTPPAFIMLNTVDRNTAYSYANAFDSPINDPNKCASKSMEALINARKDALQFTEYPSSYAWVNNQDKEYIENFSDGSLKFFDNVNDLIKQVVSEC